MHKSEQAFIAQILSEPSNDDIRLVYADWLEERGELARADFLRLELQLDSLALGAPEFCETLGQLFGTMDAVSPDPSVQSLLMVAEEKLIANWTTTAWMESVRLRYEVYTGVESNFGPHPIGKIPVIRQLRWLATHTLMAAKRACEATPHRVYDLVNLEELNYLREASLDEPEHHPEDVRVPFYQLRFRRRTHPVDAWQDATSTPRTRSHYRSNQQNCRRWFQIGWDGDSSLMDVYFPSPQASVEQVGQPAAHYEQDEDGRCWVAIANTPALLRIRDDYRRLTRHSANAPPWLCIRPVYRGPRQIVPPANHVNYRSDSYYEYL